MKKTIFILLIAFSGPSFAMDFGIFQKRAKGNPMLKNPSANIFENTLPALKKSGGDDAFAQGKFVMSAGYGWPNLAQAIIQAILDETSNNSNVVSTGFGPAHFRGEYGISDNVGLAASVNYISSGFKWNSRNDSTGITYQNKVSRNSLSILARLNFHFAITEQVDPYFGIAAGYKNVTWTLKSDDPDFNDYTFKPFSPFGFETTIGVRYYLMDGFGLYAEFGLAKSLVQGGVVVGL